MVRKLFCLAAIVSLLCPAGAPLLAVADTETGTCSLTSERCRCPTHQHGSTGGAHGIQTGCHEEKADDIPPRRHGYSFSTVCSCDSAASLQAAQRFVALDRDLEFEHRIVYAGNVLPRVVYFQDPYPHPPEHPPRAA